MPTFIPDRLKTPGDFPSVDANDNQIRGFGFFDDNDARAALNENFRCTGYLAFMKDTDQFKQYNSRFVTDEEWGSDANWFLLEGTTTDTYWSADGDGSGIYYSGQVVVGASTYSGDEDFYVNGTAKVTTSLETPVIKTSSGLDIVINTDETDTSSDDFVVKYGVVSSGGTIRNVLDISPYAATPNIAFGNTLDDFKLDHYSSGFSEFRTLSSSPDETGFKFTDVYGGDGSFLIRMKTDGSYFEMKDGGRDLTVTPHFYKIKSTVETNATVTHPVEMLMPSTATGDWTFNHLGNKNFVFNTNTGSSEKLITKFHAYGEGVVSVGTANHYNEYNGIQFTTVSSNLQPRLFIVNDGTSNVGIRVQSGDTSLGSETARTQPRYFTDMRDDGFYISRSTSGPAYDDSADAVEGEEWVDTGNPSTAIGMKRSGVGNSLQLFARNDLFFTSGPNEEAFSVIGDPNADARDLVVASPLVDTRFRVRVYNDATNNGNIVFNSENIGNFLVARGNENVLECAGQRFVSLERGATFSTTQLNTNNALLVNSFGGKYVDTDGNIYNTEQELIDAGGTEDNTVNPTSQDLGSGVAKSFSVDGRTGHTFAHKKLGVGVDSVGNSYSIQTNGRILAKTPNPYGDVGQWAYNIERHGSTAVVGALGLRSDGNIVIGGFNNDKVTIARHVSDGAMNDEIMGHFNSTGLGLGTTSPSAKLHVDGSIYFNLSNGEGETSLSSSAFASVAGLEASNNFYYKANGNLSIHGTNATVFRYGASDGNNGFAIDTQGHFRPWSGTDSLDVGRSDGRIRTLYASESQTGNSKTAFFTISSNNGSSEADDLTSSLDLKPDGETYYSNPYPNITSWTFRSNGTTVDADDSGNDYESNTGLPGYSSQSEIMKIWGHGSVSIGPVSEYDGLADLSHTPGVPATRLHISSGDLFLDNGRFLQRGGNENIFTGNIAFKAGFQGFRQAILSKTNSSGLQIKVDNVNFFYDLGKYGLSITDDQDEKGNTVDKPLFIKPRFPSATNNSGGYTGGGNDGAGNINQDRVYPLYFHYADAPATLEHLTIRTQVNDAKGASYDYGLDYDATATQGATGNPFTANKNRLKISATFPFAESQTVDGLHTELSGVIGTSEASFEIRNAYETDVSGGTYPNTSGTYNTALYVGGQRFFEPRSRNNTVLYGFGGINFTRAANYGTTGDLSPEDNDLVNSVTTDVTGGTVGSYVLSTSNSGEITLGSSTYDTSVDGELSLKVTLNAADNVSAVEIIYGGGKMTGSTGFRPGDTITIPATKLGSSSTEVVITLSNDSFITDGGTVSMGLTDKNSIRIGVGNTSIISNDTNTSYSNLGAGGSFRLARTATYTAYRDHWFKYVEGGEDGHWAVIQGGFLKFAKAMIGYSNDNRVAYDGTPINTTNYGTAALRIVASPNGMRVGTHAVASNSSSDLKFAEADLDAAGFTDVNSTWGVDYDTDGGWYIGMPIYISEAGEGHMISKVRPDGVFQYNSGSDTSTFQRRIVTDINNSTRKLTLDSNLTTSGGDVLVYPQTESDLIRCRNLMGRDMFVVKSNGRLDVESGLIKMRASEYNPVANHSTLGADECIIYYDGTNLKVIKGSGTSVPTNIA